MENKIYGYVYLITNKINGKQYVGQTVRTIKKRFNGHCGSKKQVISRAIKKYGKENFIVQELAVAYNQKELTFLEGMYIGWFNTLVFSENGYNVSKIINGKGKHSEETKQKIKNYNNQPERLKLSSKIGKSKQGKNCSKKSKYCGVTIYNVYYSSICFNYKTIFLGHYNIETDAAKAYDIAAIKYFGNDAVLNFPELRQNYIDGKIIINKNTKQTNSKSREKGIYFHKKSNKWYYKWFEKNLNKYKTKYFNTLEEAIKYKLQ